MKIGGDQRKSITAVVTASRSGIVVAHQNHPHGAAAKRAIPEADPFGDLHGVGTPVPTDLGAAPGVRPRRKGGDIGRGAQPGTAGAGTARAPGAGRGQLVQHRGDLQPAGPADPAVHVAQAFPDVGGVADHVHRPVGMAGGSRELPHDASDGRRHCLQGVITTVRSRRIDITLLADRNRPGWVLT